jgi:hypothetical protein
VASVWRKCDKFGVYNLWGLCGEVVICLEFIICGNCVERIGHIWSL